MLPQLNSRVFLSNPKLLLAVAVSNVLIIGLCFATYGMDAEGAGVATRHRKVRNLLLFGGVRRSGTWQMAAMVSRRRKPNTGIRRGPDGAFLFRNRAAYEVRGRASAIGRSGDSHYSGWFFDRARSRDHGPTTHSVGRPSCRASGLAVHNLASSCRRLRTASDQVTSAGGDPIGHCTCFAALAARPHNRSQPGCRIARILGYEGRKMRFSAGIALRILKESAVYAKSTNAPPY